MCSLHKLLKIRIHHIFVLKIAWPSLQGDKDHIVHYYKSNVNRQHHSTIQTLFYLAKIMYRLTPS